MRETFGRSRQGRDRETGHNSWKPLSSSACADGGIGLFRNARFIGHLLVQHFLDDPFKNLALARRQAFQPLAQHVDLQAFFSKTAMLFDAGCNRFQEPVFAEGFFQEIQRSSGLVV